jgi:threonine/homoserine/homoserine lactone efflux protein
MPKAVCWTGFGVAGLVFLLFLLDLVAGIPFQKASMLMDILFMVGSLMLAYLSWSALREVR